MMNDVRKPEEVEFLLFSIGDVFGEKHGIFDFARLKRFDLNFDIEYRPIRPKELQFYWTMVTVPQGFLEFGLSFFRNQLENGFVVKFFGSKS